MAIENVPFSVDTSGNKAFYPFTLDRERNAQVLTLYREGLATLVRHVATFPNSDFLVLGYSGQDMWHDMQTIGEQIDIAMPTPHIILGGISWQLYSGNLEKMERTWQEFMGGRKPLSVMVIDDFVETGRKFQNLAKLFQQLTIPARFGTLLMNENPELKNRLFRLDIFTALPKFSLELLDLLKCRRFFTH